MNEEFKYFICYTKGNRYFNRELKYKYIDSITDIEDIQINLQDNENDLVTITNYRMF